MRSLGNIRSFQWRPPVWSLAAVNWTLGSLVAGELAAWGWLTAQPLPVPTDEWGTPPSTSTTMATPVEFQTPSETPTGAARPLSLAASRRVFQAAGPLPESRQRAASSTPKMQAMAARLSLVGMVAGPSPQAIIQDAETQKTYFVTAGQHVVDGTTVAAIREDRVTLEYHGETLELSF